MTRPVQNWSVACNWGGAKTKAPATAADVLKQHDRTKKFQALGRMPKGRMNKTEAAYAAYLGRQQLAGEILEFRFHPLRVRLADNTYYEIDFLVMGKDMGLEFHETKGGFTTDKGQMKIKLCAEALPFIRMLKVTKLADKDGGGWKTQEYF
ncbi:hypothetical protein [Herbaspirillum sp. NPDC101397]|uniref:hypothetical protein n=1 Tax=Herbaspirillum sp. NPDC101397 TaxID=3364006 RepID=UPI00383AD66F